MTESNFRIRAQPVVVPICISGCPRGSWACLPFLGTGLLNEVLGVKAILRNLLPIEEYRMPELEREIQSPTGETIKSNPGVNHFCAGVITMFRKATRLSSLP